LPAGRPVGIAGSLVDGGAGAAPRSAGASTAATGMTSSRSRSRRAASATRPGWCSGRSAAPPRSR
jgi:hypothetical protein